jgi:hypothetical protein
VAIHGPLRELGIHDVFQLLDLSRKTGVLRVSSEVRQNEGTIWFESGAVVAASIRSNPHRIGDILLRGGKVREEDVVRAREMQHEGDARRMGEILVAIGALSRRGLEQQVRQQVEEVVFTVLGWSEGHFTFEEGVAAEIPRDAAIRISTESLMMEAARRIDEWSRIQDRVPHLGVVPRLAAPDTDDPGPLQLTPFEWRVLAGCDGVLDVRSIARSLAASDFDVARTLFGLAAAGVLVLQDPASTSAAAAPRQNAMMLLGQGETFLRRGDVAAARTMAEAVIASFPDDARGPLLLGRLHLDDGRFAEAAGALELAVRLDSGGGTALRLLGMALTGAGAFGPALTAWERWLQLADRPAEEDRYLAEVSRMIEAARVLGETIRSRS